MFTNETSQNVGNKWDKNENTIKKHTNVTVTVYIINFNIFEEKLVGLSWLELKKLEKQRNRVPGLLFCHLGNVNLIAQFLESVLLISFSADKHRDLFYFLSSSKIRYSFLLLSSLP